MVTDTELDVTVGIAGSVVELAVVISEFVVIVVVPGLTVEQATVIVVNITVAKINSLLFIRLTLVYLLNLLLFPIGAA